MWPGSSTLYVRFTSAGSGTNDNLSCRSWPGILLFLGYYPAGEETPAELVLKARRCQGMDQKGLAQVVGVIHQRLRRWEHGEEIPTSDKLKRLRSVYCI